MSVFQDLTKGGSNLPLREDSSHHQQQIQEVHPFLLDPRI